MENDSFMPRLILTPGSEQTRYYLWVIHKLQNQGIISITERVKHHWQALGAAVTESLGLPTSLHTRLESHLCFWFQLPTTVHPVISQQIGILLSIWEFQMKFQVPGLSVIQIWLLWTFLKKINLFEKQSIDREKESTCICGFPPQMLNQAKAWNSVLIYMLGALRALGVSFTAFPGASAGIWFRSREVGS